MAGFRDPSTAIWLSNLVAATNAIFTIISIFLIDRIGRRPLLLATIVPAVFMMGFLGFSFYARRNHLIPAQYIGLFSAKKKRPFFASHNFSVTN